MPFSRNQNYIIPFGNSSIGSNVHTPLRYIRRKPYQLPEETDTGETMMRIRKSNEYLTSKAKLYSESESRSMQVI